MERAGIRWNASNLLPKPEAHTLSQRSTTRRSRQQTLWGEAAPALMLLHLSFFMSIWLPWLDKDDLASYRFGMSVLFNYVKAPIHPRSLSVRKSNIPQIPLPSSSQHLVETSTAPYNIRFWFSNRRIWTQEVMGAVPSSVEILTPSWW